jgi:SnoaL-like polyketide cyclase
MPSSLSPEQRKALIRHYLETTWNTRTAHKRRDVTLPDAHIQQIQQSEQTSPDVPAPDASPLDVPLCAAPPSPALLQLHQAIQCALPDVRITVLDLVAEGEMVVARWRIQGVDLGGYEGHLPTGRVIQLTGITMVRLQDRVIVEEWNEIDLVGMLRQLGIVSLPQSPRITVKRPRPTSPFSTYSSSTRATQREKSERIKEENL